MADAIKKTEAPASLNHKKIWPGISGMNLNGLLKTGSNNPGAIKLATISEVVANTLSKSDPATALRVLCVKTASPPAPLPPQLWPLLCFAPAVTNYAHNRKTIR